MADSTNTQRDAWGSRIGFVLAAAGSAVGLGNIWRFPYVAGESGGGMFVLIYLICVVFISVPYLFAELSLGRHKHRNPVGAIMAIKGRSAWMLIGFLCITAGLVILSYYGVIAGWAIGYVAKDVIAPGVPFGEFIATPALVIPLLALFLGLTLYVVTGGIQQGIERWAKLLMPLLLVLMLIIIIRSLTLEGASEGIAFYLMPDLSQISGAVVLTALGQAFFSLSLGMGAMITYGSYLNKQENIATSGGYVAVFDTSIAILAGFMIFPAVFALGMEPDAGPALVFEILPAVFAEMPMGAFIGVLFFLLLSIGALTSSISLLEVVVSYFIDEQKWSRMNSVLTIGAIAFVLAIPSALSQGAVGWLSDLSWLFGEGGLLGQNDFLGILDYFFGSLFLAIGAFFISIFVGWVWGAQEAVKEIQQGSNFTGWLVTVWVFMLRWVCPLFIFISLIYMIYEAL